MDSSRFHSTDSITCFTVADSSFPSDASNTIDVLTVEAGVEVELFTVSSCSVVDKENDLIFCRSKFKAILVSKSAAGRSYDTEVLLFVDLTIDRS
ncbi:hypothetical protein TNIN_490921 [Trichonephila inaurata madagascariensis]|uniref:Uncharacterized protein n=1 Tax=Trichonephila inaurata madagascariensis TaxID=2747483 RepID=A0A8X7CQQ2_9ARAC|nr:hypothetical protein TNIN_490921 [Trichonephila inaurata madagascariensis]